MIWLLDVRCGTWLSLGALALARLSQNLIDKARAQIYMEITS